MKIGIIVHSKTGNTEAVAQKLKESYIAKGHDVTLEKVVAVNDEEMDITKIKFESMPKIAGYDVLILAAPVRAFSLSSVIKAYISKIKSLKGIKTGVFVTQQLALKQLGGNHAIKQFKKACQAKESEVSLTGIINWSNKKRDEQIDNLIKDFSKI